MQLKLSNLLFLSGLLIVSIYSCRQENFFEGSDITFSVSADTIRYDTVFTEVGTTTKVLKLYNEEEASVIIDEIKLLNLTDFFRLNIDGTPINELSSIEIAPKDSLYVFIEATINPNLPLELSPYIIEDQLRITAGENSKIVYLEAWGQDANYLPNRFASSEISFTSCDLGEWVWDDPKPYVIYGSLLIDSCEVVWPAGTRVFVHGGIAINDLGVYNDGLIFFLPNGSLRSEGTAENPVTVLTDRLEEEWLEDGGQWSGIIFGAGSQGNEMNHTRISNSIVGIRVDSTSSIRLNACEFSYTSGSGIIGRHGNIIATNCLVHNNGQYGLQFVFGGNYIFDNCTIANFDNQSEALFMNNFECTDPFCQEPPQLFPALGFFRNCIFSGNDNDEIGFADATVDVDDFEFRFTNCIVQVDELLEPESFPNFFDNCESCLNNVELDSLFIDYRLADYHLDTMSIAIDRGVFINNITTDIEGNLRESNAFDIGCYEFQK